jgi:hypothetical protein
MSVVNDGALRSFSCTSSVKNSLFVVENSLFDARNSLFALEDPLHSEREGPAMS